MVTVTASNRGAPASVIDLSRVNYAALQTTVAPRLCSGGVVVAVVEAAVAKGRGRVVLMAGIGGGGSESEVLKEEHIIEFIHFAKLRGWVRAAVIQQPKSFRERLKKAC